MVKKKKDDLVSSSRAADIVRNLQSQDKSKYNDLMLLSEGFVKVPVVSSGILSLDIVVGGGYPYGRIVELFGNEGGGKTTCALHAAAAVQKNGGVCAFVDAEHSLNVTYASRIGVNVSELLIYQPSSGENALNLINDLAPVMKPGDLVVVDSVAALTPQAEIDGEIGDQFMGLHARLMSQAMRKLAGSVSKSGVIVLFLNQIRAKIGVVYGSNETTTGGNALKFYATIRIEVRKTNIIKKDNLAIGQGIRFRTIKNKVFPPYRDAETVLKFGKGVTRSSDLLSIAEASGIVKKSGAWIFYGDTQLGQGQEKAVEMLDLNPNIADDLEKQVLAQYKG